MHLLVKNTNFWSGTSIQGCGLGICVLTGPPEINTIKLIDGETQFWVAAMLSKYKPPFSATFPEEALVPRKASETSSALGREQGTQERPGLGDWYHQLWELDFIMQPLYVLDSSFIKWSQCSLHLPTH